MQEQMAKTQAELEQKTVEVSAGGGKVKVTANGAGDIVAIKIDKEDFDHFIENQKRDLRVFVDGQPAQAQERAEKLTLRILEIAAKVAIALI